MLDEKTWENLPWILKIGMTQRYHRALWPVFHIAVLGIVLVDAFMSIQKQTKGGRPRRPRGRWLEEEEETGLSSFSSFAVVWYTFSKTFGIIQ